LFERIRQFLNPVDDVDKSTIGRERTFPFRESKPANQAA
jgi:hypothetical protein